MNLVPWLTLALSVLTIGGAAINVYIGLRLSSLQSKMKADSSAFELSLLKQFVVWKDDVLGAINGKYVSAALIAEMRSGVGHEISQIQTRLERFEQGCEAP